MFLPNIMVLVTNVTDSELATMAYKMNAVFLDQLKTEDLVIHYFSEEKAVFSQHLGSRNGGFRNKTIATVLGVVDEKRDWENNRALKHLLRDALEEVTKFSVIVV